MNKIARLWRVGCTALALILTNACSLNDSAYEDFEPSNAFLYYNSVIWMATDAAKGTEQNRIVTQGNPHIRFTATIINGKDFCSFSKRQRIDSHSGHPGEAGVYLYFDSNDSNEDRVAEIFVQFDDNSFADTLRCTQRRYSVSAVYDRHSWMELPEYVDNNNYIYKTYFTTLTSSVSTVRNFTVCYDTKRKVSQWVAYPLHKCYLSPSLTRVNTFGYDPNDQAPEIPRELQQNITSGYGTGRHDRGHMLPNASRYNNYDANRMTYYATNMMPQNSQFNQKSWAELEGKVRATTTADTLFVVTGTYFATDATISNSNGPIAEPSHAYKVLLKARTRVPAGKTLADLTADELLTIGFWFENTTEAGTMPIADAVKSVAEIEAITGFKYFQMLPDNVADIVKQQKNLNDWSGF